MNLLQFQIDLCSQLLAEKSVKLVRVGMMQFNFLFENTWYGVEL